MNEEIQKDRAEAFRRYGLSAFLFAGLLVVCLYKNTAAITYPVYMAGSLVLLHRILPLNFKEKATKFYVVALMLLAISKCTTASEALQRMDGIAIFLLFFSLLIHRICEDADWELTKRLRALGKAVVTPWLTLFEFFRDQAAFVRERRDKSKKSSLGAVGIGLLIALPLVFVVLLLLGSADKVFGDMVESLLEELDFLENIADHIEILLLFLCSLLGWYAGAKVFTETGLRVSDREHKQYDAVTGITINALLTVVYVTFSMVQIVVLFTGGMVLPAKYTYAEYAHQGFYQLLFVCLINLLVVTVSKAMFVPNKVLNLLLAMICGCTYIMIVSGCFRMILYVKAYQFTFLRLFVLWAMGIIAIWLTAILLHIFREEVRVYRVCLVAVTIGYLLFAFAHPDYWIAKYNMSKEPVGQSAYDQRYLIDHLSADALPAYLKDQKLLERYRNHYLEEQDGSQSLLSKARHFNISIAVAEHLMEKQ